MEIKNENAFEYHWFWFVGFCLKWSIYSYYFINSEVMHKPINLLTIEDKEKVKQIFQVKYLMISVLRTRECNYVLTVELPKKCETPLKWSMKFPLRSKGKWWTW